MILAVGFNGIAAITWVVELLVKTCGKLSVIVQW
jgi:hypothetical protein